jgi:hypothetical protein
MLKKLLIALAPIAGFALLTAGTMSDNGKAGNTGSPGELTCTDCHSTYAINTGIGSVSLSGITGSQYNPGQLYAMKVTVRFTGRALFGVGLEALTATGADGGRLIITDPARTQIKTSTVLGNVRRNLVHQLNGGARTDSMEFNFAWRAPYKGAGTVTFYFCGVAANANGSESGDYVYQGTNLVLTEGPCASTAPPSPGTITASANPFCTGMTVNYSISAVAGATSYEWYFPNNWSSSDTITTLPGVAVTTGTNTGTVTVFAVNGCAASSGTLTVTAQNITTSTTGTNPTCGGSNGSVSVTASNGVSPYTYVWTNGTTVVGTTSSVTGLSAGTYLVTVTDSRGCTKTATRTLTSSGSAVIPAASGSSISCSGGTTGSVSVTVTGGTTPYTYSWRNGTVVVGTTASVTGLAAGTYTVTVTDAAGCSGTSSATITSSSSVTATASSTAATCSNSANGTVSVTASGGTAPLTYVWRNSSNVSVGTTASVSNLAAGSYTVTITDAAGCSTTAVATVTAPPAVTGSVTANNPACSTGSTGSVSVAAAGGTAPYTYNWTNGTTSVGTSASVNNLGAGTYTVTVTDSRGCTGTSSATLTAPAPVVATPASTNPACNTGNTGSASVTVAGGTPGYTYQWRNGTTAVGSTATISNLGAGTYTVTVTDTRGCTATSSVTLVAPTVVTATATSTNPACSTGNTGSATVTATGGTPGYTYQWRNGTTSVGTSQNLANIGAGTYSVTVTDSRGCTTTSTVTLTAPSPVTATTSTTAATCYGLTNGQATVAAGGGTSPYTYSWSNGGTGTTVINLAAGTYTVTVTDSRSCTRTASATVSQPPAISLSVATVDASCGSANGSATVSSPSTIATYAWSNGETTSTISNLTSGSYSVTVTDANGCSASVSATVANIGGPTVAISASQQVSCYGGSDGAAVSNVSAGTPPYVYAWSTGDSSASVSNLTAGTYQLTVTDSLGCLSAASVSISEPSQVMVMTGSSQTVCEGDSVTLSASAAGGTGAFTYEWSDVNGILGYDTVVTFVAASSGSLTFTATDANGCTASSSVLLTVDPAPASPAITNSNDTLFATPGGNYEWFLDGIVIPGSSGATYILPAANGNYTVTATDPSTGCTSASAPFSYLSTGLHPLAVTSAWRLFPNPASCTVLLISEHAFTAGDIRILDSTGRLVHTTAIRQNVCELNVADWTPGIYSVLLTGQQQLQVLKLVIQH